MTQYKPSPLNSWTKVYWIISLAIRGRLPWQISAENAADSLFRAITTVNPNRLVHRKLVDLRNQFIHGS